MSHRVDVLERDYPPPLSGQPRCIGYGYRFDAELGPQLQLALADGKTHSLRRANAPTSAPPAPYLAEVRPRAGVTDNVAQSVLALLANASSRHGVEHSVQRVASGRIYALAETESAAKLYNPIVESIEVLSARAWAEHGFASAITAVQLPAQPASINIDLDQLDDEQLTELSKLGIDDGQRRRGPLGLSLDDLCCLRDYYRKLNRPIRDIELETFAQSWSEHCKHRFFAASIDEINEGLFRRYIQSATEQISATKPGFCLSVFHDNAGAIAFGDHVLAYKVETHNSPSALDPYGGAMTGILGVNRDCLGFGMGAEPIANVFGFCLPHPDDQRQLFRDPKLQQPLPSAAELGAGVIRGVEEGGNHSGIPTVQGFVYTHPSFRGKPLVYCGTLGILPRQVQGPDGLQDSTKKSVHAGDWIYVLGNHVGFDGIHGATFSSVELDANSPATAVQIGDPIAQKNLQDVLFKARDRGLYRCITDNGAGGLSSSIGEMAQASGGAEVWLERVQLKYSGLAPWEIWISESQERMLVAIPPERAADFEQLLARYQVSTQRLGRFTDDGYLRLHYQGKEIGCLAMDFLHHGAPQRRYSSQEPTPAPQAVPQEQPEPSLEQLLSQPNFQSRAGVFQRYDHEVQGNSLMKPLVGGVDSPVSALRPIWSQPQAVALSQALLPHLTEVDPYHAGYVAVDLALRKLIAAGADPEQLAILDNYCWSRPESGERLYQLKECTRGLHTAAVHLRAPIISGKDSMYNDFQGYAADGAATSVSALPTLLVSAIGIINDYRRALNFAFKTPGDTIAILAYNARPLPLGLGIAELYSAGSPGEREGKGENGSAELYSAGSPGERGDKGEMGAPTCSRREGEGENGSAELYSAGSLGEREAEGAPGSPTCSRREGEGENGSAELYSAGSPGEREAKGKREGEGENKEEPPTKLPPLPHPRDYTPLAQAIAHGDLASAEALAAGGIAYAVARAALASGLGAHIQCQQPYTELDSGFLITGKRERLPAAARVIGTVQSQPEVQINTEVLSLSAISRLYHSGAYAGVH